MVHYVSGVAKETSNQLKYNFLENFASEVLLLNLQEIFQKEIHKRYPYFNLKNKVGRRSVNIAHNGNNNVGIQSSMISTRV